MIVRVDTMSPPSESPKRTGWFANVVEEWRSLALGARPATVGTASLTGGPRVSLWSEQ
jgi:hypothetical protein